MNTLSKELIGASSIPIILSILSRGESYGYEIIQQIREISDGNIEYKDGTLYPVLHKLEKKGMITAVWKTADTGRKRKYYQLSGTGKQTLSQEKENWTIINQIMSKLWNIETNLT